MRKFTTRQLTTAAIVGALYAALAVFSSVFGIAYGPVQCRFSEALCVLPFLFPETVWGLFAGCLIANIISPYGLLDVIFGSLATLLAALWTARCRRRVFAPLPPVVCNALLVGAVLAWQQSGTWETFAPAFAFNAISVAVGQAIACYGLGLLLLTLLQRSPYFRNLPHHREN